MHDLDGRGLEAAREDELLPCPFCGSQPLSPTPESTTVLWEIGCPGNWHRNHDCSAGPGVDGKTYQEAAAKWNRRASSPNTGEVEVRELEWVANLVSSCVAYTPFGSYACPRFGDQWDALRDGQNMHPRVHGVIKAYDTLDEAKAFCQADYAQRIRSALAPSPQQHSSQADAPGIPATGSEETDDIDSMLKISKLIADLQDVHARFGDTCVYIRRGGMSWGAVALNRQADDKKNGVFDLHATHDKVMGELGAQVGRLKADRDQWRSLYWRVAVKPGEPIPFDAERLLADIEPSPANPAETQADGAV